MICCSIAVDHEDTDELKFRNAELEYVDNLINLPYLNEPELLTCLQNRFEKGIVYTYTGPVLIAINPYETMKDSKAVHGIELFENFVQTIKSSTADIVPSSNVVKHSIMISGESGSGKTECAKKILQILVMKEIANLTFSPIKVNRGEEKDPILNKVLQAATVFKSFGNATTLHSLNSSRFGQFINISFNAENDAVDANIKTYLLENIRVVHQLFGERNFHIFYQILSGISEEERKTYKLYDSVSYRYISPTAASVASAQGKATTPSHKRQISIDTKTLLSSAPMNYQEEFQQLKEHMLGIGFPQENLALIFQTIAGILHLGQIQFESRNKLNDEGSEIAPDQLVDGESYLDIAARLCQVNAGNLRQSLLERTITSQRETVTMQLSIGQATLARDAIAKAMYLRLFDFLTEEINGYLKTNSSSSVTSSIGILDIFGFDSFEENSLEQLCINYANESLQQQFNQQIFKFQLEEYRKEDIIFENISFQDNQDSMELISNGIFRILDDQCRLPDPSDKRFVNQLYKDYSSHNRFVATSAQRARNAFAVDHFAGQVTYNSEGFIQKNLDELPAQAVLLLSSSSNQLFTKYQPVVDELNTTGGTGMVRQKSGHLPRGARNASSAVFQFKQGLSALIQHVSQSTPHYIRCLNPIDRADLTGGHGAISPMAHSRSNNQLPTGKKVLFNQFHVAEQLRYGGILEAIRVSRSGFPIRFTHREFVQRYLVLLDASVLGSTPEYQSILATLKKQASVKHPLPEMKEACRSLLQQLSFSQSGSRLQRALAASAKTAANSSSAALHFSPTNVQIGLLKIFLKSQENETLESVRSQYVQLALRVVLRFLLLVYRKRKEIIRKKQQARRHDFAIKIQKRMRVFLAKKRLRELKDWQFYKSVSQDPADITDPVNLGLQSDSIDHESLASYNSELTGVFSTSDALPPHIASMGRKARKARAHKQLGTKINEYKAMDEELLREITKLLEVKKKFDESTILRFDISTAKRLLTEWSQGLASLPASASSAAPTDMKNKALEVAKLIDFGYQVLLPDKLIPMSTLGKAFNFGRSVAADSRVNSAKTCNKVVTKDHKIFKRIYLIIDHLKELIDRLTDERNQLEDKQAILQQSSQASLLGEGLGSPSNQSEGTSTGNPLEGEMNRLVGSLALILQILEVCKILYQYYVQYITHTVREYGENSPYKQSFKSDEVAYILAFASVLEAHQPFLSAERNDDFLKKKVAMDDIFPMALSIPALHEMYFTPLPEDMAAQGDKKSGGVVCKYVVASPGNEYVLNCLYQLLAGDVLMYPIKLIKLVGKSTKNYGQIAYYQAALQFTEHTLRSSVSNLQQMSQVDGYSYSLAFLTSLLAGVSRSRPENYMVRVSKDDAGRDRYEIVGFNNDEELSEQLFAVKETLKPAATSSVVGAPPAEFHALNLLPQFYQPIDPALVSLLLSHRALVEETISSLLREIYLQNKRYESLLSSGFSTKDLLTLNVPIELSKLAAIKLYKKMNVVWNALRENATVTHHDLFALLYPGLVGRYGQQGLNQRLSSAAHRANDIWYDFYNNNSLGLLDSRSRSFYKTGSLAQSSSQWNLLGGELGMSLAAASSLDYSAANSRSNFNLTMVGLTSERTAIEEISTEFIKCVDFAHFLRGSRPAHTAATDGIAGDVDYELFACGNISDNLSFLPTLWLRNVNEEQLIIMFGGLIENCYRSLHPSGPAGTHYSMGSVNTRASVVSSKLFLKTIVLLGIDAALRRALKATDVILCLETILSVRVAFGEQDVSHFRLQSNEDIDSEDEDGEPVDSPGGNDQKKGASYDVDDNFDLDEDQLADINDRLAFLDDLLVDYQRADDEPMVRSVMKMRRALKVFLVKYPEEANKPSAMPAKKKTDSEIHSDCDLVLEVAQISYENKESFCETIASLQLLEFTTLLFKVYELLYPVALDFAKRGVFNYHNHILQYLLIQPALEKWEDLLHQIVFQQPFLVFQQNTVDHFLPCDRLKQMTLSSPASALLSPGATSSTGLVSYRLMVSMFNATYPLFAIKPLFFNEFFDEQFTDGLALLQFSSKKATTIPLFPHHPPALFEASPPEDDKGKPLPIDRVLHSYSGDEELIFMAVRYGFFASLEELQERKYNFWKKIFVNFATESLSQRPPSHPHQPNPQGSRKDLTFNLLQCCLHLSKQTDLSPAVAKENQQVSALLLKAIGQRIASRELTKEQLYDLIYTNGQGKVIVSNKSHSNNDFMKELQAFLN